MFTADGKPMTVRGTVDLSLNINGLIVPFYFHVVEHLYHQMLLGVDFLTKTRTNIDFSDGKITFYDGLAEATLNKHSDTLLKTVEAVLIPPKSEALIPVSIPPYYTPKLSVIEPATSLHVKKLALAKAIVNPTKNRTVCKVLNPTNEPVFLRRRAVLATIQSLTADDICSVTDAESHLISESTNEEPTTLKERLEAIARKEIHLERNEMTEEQFEQLSKLIYKNLDLFATELTDLVGTDIVTHNIDTGDSPPIRKRPYRNSPQITRELKKKVQELLDADIIEETDSPWNSPCLLIKKSGGKEYRFVSDMRALNSVTKPIHWPLPTMTDVLDTVADVSPRFFSQTDFRSAYFQVHLTEESKPKTAFTVAGRNYQYKRLVMGLCNSAQCWQRLLTSVLGDMVFSSAIVYLDDVLLVSRTFDQHCSHLSAMFDKFRAANLRLNGKKCKFATSQVKYLGHILSKDGIATDPAKTAVIVNWPQPKNVKQTKSFLGVCNYYRKYIFNYSIRSAPLRELTAKDVPFVWSERQEHAFADLKTALTNPPILCYPDFNRPFYVQTDASLEGIGFLLGQVDENGKKTRGSIRWSRAQTVRAQMAANAAGMPSAADCH